MTDEEMDSLVLDFHEVLHFPDDSTVKNDPRTEVFSSEQLLTVGMVSQNFSEYRQKPRGQDCATIARHKGFHCTIVCDGHDDDGFEFALKICKLLPKYLLGAVVQKFEASQDVGEALSEDVFEETFHKVQERACFSATAVLRKGLRALCIDGEYKGRLVEVVEASEAEQENGSSEVLVKLIDTAPCSSSLPDEDSPALEEDKEEEKVPVASVEETEQTEDRDDEPSVTTGSHTKSAASGRPTTSISRKELKGATMSGGTTCVCFVYHERTKLARFAVVGDSRAAVIPPVSSQLNKDLQEKEPKLSATKEELFHSFRSKKSPLQEDGDANPDDVLHQVGLFSLPHCLNNQFEETRITEAFPGRFLIDSDGSNIKVLCNPDTEEAVEPTRGFGDIDMHGTGYICIPQLSRCFTLEAGTLIIMGTDGIFDFDMWDEFQMLDYVVTTRKELGIHSNFSEVEALKNNVRKLTQDFFYESLDRAYEAYDYRCIDDMGLLCCFVR